MVTASSCPDGFLEIVVNNTILTSLFVPVHSLKYLGNINFKKYFIQSSLRQHVNRLFVTNYYVVNKHEERGRKGEGRRRRVGGREGGSGY